MPNKKARRNNNRKEKRQAPEGKIVTKEDITLKTMSATARRNQGPKNQRNKIRVRTVGNNDVKTMSYNDAILLSAMICKEGHAPGIEFRAYKV